MYAWSVTYQALLAFLLISSCFVASIQCSDLIQSGEVCAEMGGGVFFEERRDTLDVLQKLLRVRSAFLSMISALRNPVDIATCLQ